MLWKQLLNIFSNFVFGLKVQSFRLIIEIENRASHASQEKQRQLIQCSYSAHTELTLLLFFQNPYAIFAHILQHYHDFLSNVAIFPSIVQAYTHPYSYGGRIKLIICKIRHELSVTIHEINTSWKKRLGGEPYIYQNYTFQQDLMFCAAELISFGHLWAAIWHSWTIICGVPSKISVTPTS